MCAELRSVSGSSREYADPGRPRCAPPLSVGEVPCCGADARRSSSPHAELERGEAASPTVFVVDDDPQVRETVVRLVRSVGLAARAFSTADEFHEAYDPADVGCLVLDVRMPGTSGLELLEALHERGQVIPVIVLTGHADVPLAMRAIRAGAVDVLEKPFRGQTLLECVNHALTLDGVRRQALARREEYAARHALLTRREQEVMNLLLAGHEVKEIAGDLGLSHKTVQIHRAHVLEKMGVNSITNLVRLAATVCLGVDKPLP